MASGSGPSGSGASSYVHCPYHPDEPLIEDHSAGDMICPKCGLVVGDRVIDVGSEWRTFSNETSGGVNRSRVGAPEDKILGDSNMSTYIGTVTSKPGSADPGTNFPKWKKGAMSPADRTLSTAVKEIGNMAAKLNVPRIIVDRCRTLFKQVYQEKQLRGRANDAVAAACLFIACRQEEVARSFKEICAVSRHSKKEIGKCFKLIRLATNTEVNPATTADFMSRYCKALLLPNAVQKAASYIAKTAVEMDLAPGRGYLSVAAAAIYMASQASEFNKSQKEVGDVVGVADSTIRHSYRLLYPSRHNLFPADFVFATPLDQLPKH